jgi:hypothetical protein
MMITNGNFMYCREHGGRIPDEVKTPVMEVTTTRPLGHEARGEKRRVATKSSRGRREPHGGLSANLVEWPVFGTAHEMNVRLFSNKERFSFLA